MRKAVFSLPAAMVAMLAAALAMASPSAAHDAPEAGVYPWKGVLDGLAADRDRARLRLRAVMERLRGDVARDRPDLLQRLHLAPPLKPGYGVLPRVDADTPLAPVQLKRSVHSLEAWSTAVPRLIGDIDALGRRARARAADKPIKLVGRFEGLRKRLRIFANNLEYHRYWQQAVIDYPGYFAANMKVAALASALMELRDAAGGSAAAAALRARIARRVSGFRPTKGLAIGARGGNRTVLPVTVVTDIENADFLTRFRDGVERAFSRSPAARARGFEIALTIRVIPPAALYPASLYPGGAPDAGAAIDLETHAGRFPDGALVLTTGAGSTHAFTGRYIALGPSALTRRVLAHEFGHLLGFDDSYVRTVRGAPGDAYGVVVIEWLGLFDDLMGAPRSGRVSARMIDTLITNYRSGGGAP